MEICSVLVHSRYDSTVVFDDRGGAFFRQREFQAVPFNPMKECTETRLRCFRDLHMHKVCAILS